MKKILSIISLIIITLAIGHFFYQDASEDMMFIFITEALFTIGWTSLIIIPISNLFDYSPIISKIVFVILYTIRIFIVIYYNKVDPEIIMTIDLIGSFLICIPLSRFIVYLKKRFAKESNARKNVLAREQTKTIYKTTISSNNVMLSCIKKSNTFPNGDYVMIYYDDATTDDSLLENIISQEIVAQGGNTNRFYTKKSNIIRNFGWSIFLLLFALTIISYYFNYEEAVSLLLLFTGLTILINSIGPSIPLHEISRNLLKNQDSDLSLIIKDAMETNVKRIPFYMFLIIGIVIFFGLSIYYKTPRLYYIKIDDGYYVLNYTKSDEKIDVFEIPSTYNDKPITGISMMAFANSKIEKIILPDTIETIGYKAFSNSRITEINMPASLKTIEGKAFQDNSNLKKIVFNNSLVSIGNKAFDDCYSVEEFNLPNTVEHIGKYAFRECSKITEFKIPSKITELSRGLFFGCSSLNNIILPSDMTIIRVDTFNKCSSLTSLIIPEGVIKIENYAFSEDKKLSYVSIPSTINEISNHAFSECKSLKSINIPDKTIVDDKAFIDSPTIIKRYSGNTPIEENIEKNSNQVVDDKQAFDDEQAFDESTVLYETDYIAFDVFSENNYIMIEDVKFTFFTHIHDSEKVSFSGNISNEHNYQYSGNVSYKVNYYDNKYNYLGKCAENLVLLGKGFSGRAYSCSSYQNDFKEPMTNIKYYKVFIHQANLIE